MRYAIVMINKEWVVAYNCLFDTVIHATEKIGELMEDHDSSTVYNIVEIIGV